MSKSYSRQSLKQRIVEAHSDSKLWYSAQSILFKTFIWQAIVRGRPILRRAFLCPWS